MAIIERTGVGYYQDEPGNPKILKYIVPSSNGSRGLGEPSLEPSDEIVLANSDPSLIMRPIEARAKRFLERTDWRTYALDLGDADHREAAAYALAIGAGVFSGFSNFNALYGHPSLETVQRINLLKGRPRDQVGSVTTIPENTHLLFDWTKIPSQFSPQKILDLMDDFFKSGPAGFQGPASESIPLHLSGTKEDVRTTQLIAPGYRCPSNDFLRLALEFMGTDYAFITSANVSSNLTGKEEPAHHRMTGIQKDFGDKSGFVMIKHPDEEAAKKAYPSYSPRSVTILGFAKESHESGLPALTLERHGSLHVDEVRRKLKRHRVGLSVEDPKKLQRVPIRIYE